MAGVQRHLRHLSAVAMEKTLLQAASLLEMLVQPHLACQELVRSKLLCSGQAIPQRDAPLSMPRPQRFEDWSSRREPAGVWVVFQALQLRLLLAIEMLQFRLEARLHL
jgi:hypothetical protein